MITFISINNVIESYTIELKAMPVRFLIPRQKYLASGIHIGMKQKTKSMERFVYKIRPDGLAVLNLSIVDQRLRMAARFIASMDRVMVVSVKSVAEDIVEKFAEVIGAKAATGRFMPGSLTNPNYRDFYEADVMMITDPLADKQALREAVNARIPIVAIADTFNETNDIDLVIPANNKGRRALGTIYWILAREILKARGELKSDRDFKYTIEDFAPERRSERYREEDDYRRDRRNDDAY